MRRLVVLAVLGLLAFPTSASAVSCGDTITQDTTLAADLDCSDTALTITATDVTLDLAGHSITGHGSGSGIMAFNIQRVTVENGSISGFSEGIYADMASGQFVGIRALQNAGGIVTGPGRYVIRDSFLADNLYTGIAATQAGTTITGNTIRDNGFAGIVFGYRSHGGTTERNTITGNGGDGILVDVGADHLIRRNTVTDNAGNGIEVRGDPQVEASFNPRLIANRTWRNGQDGILIGTNVIGAFLARNQSFFNEGYGIEAISNVTDGGGNRAKHNGLGDCLNVTC